MQVSEFLGKKVLDKNAVEIGKVSDVDLMPKEGVINSIMISTGELLRNKTFEIKSDDIAQIGDYLLLKLEEEEIEELIQEEKEENNKKTRLTLTK
ncbi:MAG: PRC-barrel domain-containing protein [Methanobacterium sp.]|uniref:PRC-barrel domain-containing protein n=1 Tax=Methanobacterium sp. TaxID=2164 RepID=UPI003D655ADD|nr:PRC-barrel domain-containing protein [Methanobacterium sp.]